MTSAQEAVLSALERCRTPALGGHLYRCDHCGAERIAYNGCRSRHCPSCLGHKSAQWLKDREKDLIPSSYFHVVFTMPAQVAALGLGNKKTLYNILFRAASQTMLQIARDPRHLGADIGFLAILHTWTQTLLHHPHVHCVVPGGGLSPERSRWVSCRDSFFLPVRVLSRLFRGKFLEMLDHASQLGKLRFSGSTEQLNDAQEWARFIRQMRHKEWVVYAKPPFGSPEQVLKYLARYTHRVAISNRRILGIHKDRVRFRYQDRKNGNKSRNMELDGTEFLRRFLLHLLPKGFVRIRYFGIFANRVRKKNLATCRALLGSTDGNVPAQIEEEGCHDDSGLDDSKEQDLCPICRLGRMLLVADVSPKTELPKSSPAFLDSS